MSAQQAKDNISSAASTLWEWRIAIIMFMLFSINSLCMITLASLAGADWVMLDKQAKFMIYIAIMGNWTGTILAFVSKQAARIKKTGEILPEDGGTQFITRATQQTQSETVKVSSTPPASIVQPIEEKKG